MSAQAETLLTNKDLECLPDDGNRYELIEGELYVSTAPELIHQRSVGNIHFAFMNFLSKNPIGEILYGPGVILSDYDGVIPDLAPGDYRMIVRAIGYLPFDTMIAVAEEQIVLAAKEDGVSFGMEGHGVERAGLPQRDGLSALQVMDF